MRKRGFVACLLAVLALPVGAAVAKKPAPARFWGLNYAYHHELSSGELNRMQVAHVKRVRVTINWNTVEAHQGKYDWSEYDGVLGDLASRGIKTDPLVRGAPVWATGPHIGGIALGGQTDSTAPVTSPEAEQNWSKFLVAAVHRYGPDGSFWSNGYANRYPSRHPAPIHAWQIWNEPNVKGAFKPTPDAQKYAELLRISHDAILSADPGAKIILAGIPGWVQYPGWDFLSDLYQVPGIGSYFDEVALHPYADNLKMIARGITNFRHVLRANGDGKKRIWVSEFAWSSSKPDGHLNKGPVGQAELLYRGFRMLAAHRRQWKISKVSWFNWRDPSPGSKERTSCRWCVNSGLFDGNGDPKPAWNVFQRFTRGFSLGHGFNSHWLTHAPGS